MVPMKFSERELTLGVQAAAKLVHASSKGRSTDWESLTPYERYLLLEPVSTQVLPVLAALPEIEVESGSRPSFTTTQLVAAVEEVLGDVGGRIRRKVAVAGHVALVKTALDAMPPRQDPGEFPDFTVPDHL
jgi:hypothetical protein